MNRVGVEPKLLRWARERSGRGHHYLQKRFPKLDAWERGSLQPTLKQLEDFSRATYAPLGYLFLKEPPLEELPISDFRTVGDVEIRRPSPNLLDTLYLCQQRQDWYREEARTSGELPLEFVGSLDTSANTTLAGARLRDALGFDVEQRRGFATWSEALRQFIGSAEDLGILVMVSGVVGSNTHRRLDPEEFCGFVLSDALAPLVFVNGADTNAAQMFTLAHELAHLWLGESGVSNLQATSMPADTTERWCNRVAADLLAPAEVVRDDFDPGADLEFEAGRQARRFKVSTLVILRRVHDLGELSREEFLSAYHDETGRLRALQESRRGGDAIRNVGPRVSKRLARALVVSTLEGRTSYTESFRLLGLRELSTFESVAKRLGMGA